MFDLRHNPAVPIEDSLNDSSSAAPTIGQVRRCNRFVCDYFVTNCCQWRIQLNEYTGQNSMSKMLNEGKRICFDFVVSQNAGYVPTFDVSSK